MPKFNPITITLKNQKLVIIRQAEMADTENLLNCIKNYIPQSDFIPKLDKK